MSAIDYVFLGVMTLIYLVIFYFQREEIKSLKTMNAENKSIFDSMKILLDTLDVGKFKEYSDMRIEIGKMKLQKTLKDSKKMKKIVDSATKQTIYAFQNLPPDTDDKKYMELFAFTIQMLKHIPKSEVEIILKKSLKNNSVFISEALSREQDNTP